MRRLGATTVYYAAELWLSLAFAVAFTVSAVYFVTEVGMTPLELVLVGTALEATIFVFEIPTGVVADTYSRRLSLVVGWAVIGVGLVLAGSVTAVWAALAGWAIWGFGYTFTSGAYEAWITDEVGSERVGRVFARGAQLSYAGSLVGAGASVAIASVDLGAAVVTGGILASSFAVFAAATMPETGFRRIPAAEREGALRDLRRTATAGVRYVRAQPILGLILAITVFAGASTESFDRLWQAHVLENVGVPGLGALDPVVWFGVIEAVSLVLSFVAAQLLVRRFERVEAEGIARVLFALSAVQVATVVVFALAGSFALALTGLWLYYLTRRLVAPLYATWLNQSITDSRVRATVISISGQSDAIGQVAGGPVLGAVGNAFGLRAALLAGASLLAPALALYGRAIRHGGREPALDEPAATTPGPV